MLYIIYFILFRGGYDTTGIPKPITKPDYIIQPPTPILEPNNDIHTPLPDIPTPIQIPNSPNIPSFNTFVFDNIPQEIIDIFQEIIYILNKFIPNISNTDNIGRN